VLALAIDPTHPATVYAGTDGQGVFRSENGGTSWAAAASGLTTTHVLALAIDPATPATIYAATNGGGVFRTDDKGVTWVPAGLPDTRVNCLVVDPATPATLFAGTHGQGVFRSQDSGATWTAVSTNLDNGYVYSLAIDPATPTTLYAGTSGGKVYRSTNAGAWWTRYQWSFIQEDILCLAVDPAVPSTVYVGTGGNGLFRWDGIEVLTLQPSWNLVSVSAPLPLAQVLGFLQCFGYHDHWSVLTTTDTLQPGEAYWLEVSAVTTVPLTGTPAASPLSLTYEAGWQLLGNPFDVPLPIASITNHGLITTCYSYDLAWGVLNPATDSLQPGRGYWILLSSSTTLTFTHP
jgi:hypothetical protein